MTVRTTVLDVDLDIDEASIAEPLSVLRRQLREYEAGDRDTFDLTVSFPDDFTGRVMGAMCDIPYGEVRTYGELAARLETAPIAVGQACGRNPVPVVVPCHRVVGADSLGGYSAGGDRNMDLKEGLLALEGWDGTRRR